ncbi:MAG: Nif3-like dinuclear metal center hexameric protein [Saprospiraceae bacterium]|nr:Nif3-like dinuclear metal center hexameric protein [Saprospiraceae bacterium]
MIKISKVIELLENIAPSQYAESYDNARLLVGNRENTVSGVLISLDVTDAVIEEAEKLGCNLIIAHHPIIFSGLKTLTGATHVERVVIKAIKKDIALYAIHTNLDNVIYNGVNEKIAQMLSLKNLKILLPKKEMLQATVIFDGEKSAIEFKNQLQKLFEVDWTSLSTFSTIGVYQDSNSTQAQINCSFVFPSHLQQALLKVVSTFQSEKKISHLVIQPTELPLATVGSGMIGSLEEPMDTKDVLHSLKKVMKANCVKHTKIVKKKIQTIAVCGGAGSFLLQHAIRAGAELFISSDFKYHEFFNADNNIVIADIGHYESEQYTGEIIFDIISKKFTTFAVYLTEVNTNPIQYII